MVEWWVGHDEKKKHESTRISVDSLPPRIAFAHRRSPPPETGGREPDALIRLALIHFHYQFEAIRPFGDANGKNPEHPLSD